MYPYPIYVSKTLRIFESPFRLSRDYPPNPVLFIGGAPHDPYYLLTQGTFAYFVQLMKRVEHAIAANPDAYTPAQCESARTRWGVVQDLAKLILTPEQYETAQNYTGPITLPQHRYDPRCFPRRNTPPKESSTQGQ